MIIESSCVCFVCLFFSAKCHRFSLFDFTGMPVMPGLPSTPGGPGSPCLTCSANLAMMEVSLHPQTGPPFCTTNQQSIEFQTMKSAPLLFD